MTRFYRHYKHRLQPLDGEQNRGIYEVLGLVRDARDGASMVLYRNADCPDLHWVRGRDEFFGDVDVDGDTLKRFAPLDDYPVPDHTVWHHI